MIGRTISHYEILEKLGEGGMGVVYKARDTKLNRDVALKFLPAGLTSDEESRKRFVREAQAAAALNHPNICAVYEIGEADGHTFIVMPCIGGASLADRIRGGQLSTDEALDIAIQVGKGLAKAHENGIVHRDIKPGNIVVDEHGLAKVVDFGLAKLGSLSKMTMVGITLGTVGYMSPEQARGDEVDHRSDIWALGVVLYEMLSGRMPFRGEVDAAVIYSIINEEPEPLTENCPECPAELAEVINAALAKELDDRFQSMDDMVAALEAVRDGESIQAVRRPRKKTGSGARRRIAIAATALLVIAAAIVGYILLRPGQSIRSVAVLPLVDLSGKNEEGGFADQQTSGLRSELGQISAVSWTSLYSVMQFKDSHMTVPEFCEKLGVDAAVVGSVERDGSRVLLRLQLVEADSERQLWAEDYDRDQDKLSAVYSEVALDIAEQLQVVMNPDAAAAMASRRPVDPEAHDAYLKGTYWLRNKGDEVKALEFFNKSIEADPTYANAWAGSAECHIQLSHGWIPDSTEVKMALAAVEHALELDNALGEAYHTKAHILWEHEFDQAGAKEAFRKAFELNPSNAYGMIIYAYYLLTTGGFEEAADAATGAIRIDPLSYFINLVAFEPMAFGGMMEEAIAHVESMGNMFPDDFHEYMKHDILKKIYDYNGDYDKAIEEILISRELFVERSVSLDSLFVDRRVKRYLFDMALLYSVASMKEKADEMWAEYESVTDINNLETSDPFKLSLYYIWYKKDLDKAFSVLDRMYETKNMWLTRITYIPWFEPLRGDPRYDKLVKRMGLR